MSDTYTWDWANDMHIGYTPERIRVEGRGGAAEYVPDRGTCSLTETGHEYEVSYRCSACKQVVWIDFRGNPKPNYCPNCGAEVVDE